MRRLFVSKVADALRSIVVLAVLGVTAIGAWFVGSTPFHRTDYGCGNTRNSLVCLLLFHLTRFAWQIPVAVVIAVVGFGLAAFVASWRRTRRPERALPITAEWPVRRIAA
jgi:hypothetical protein